MWELRIRKSAIRVQAAQIQKGAAAVNKKEGRYKAANLKACIQYDV